ncbi:MAG: DUF1801 domain-containing protein [Bacteroidetes bacterium]|nr:DUF1801 domain-containing protein [Bacteroidota bacterium]
MALRKFHGVEDYIDYFPLYGDVLQKLRQLILSTSPKIHERIRYNFPFYDYHGMLLFLAVQKKRVVIGFVDGSQMSDTAGAFASFNQKYIRHLRYQTTKDIVEDIVLHYVHEAMLLKEMK